MHGITLYSTIILSPRVIIREIRNKVIFCFHYLNKFTIKMEKGSFTPQFIILTVKNDQS